MALGPRDGETKVVLDDGSGLQKSFLNMTFVKKALGRPAEDISQTSSDIRKRQRELEKERGDLQFQQQNLRDKNEEIQNMNERLNKEQAKSLFRSPTFAKDAAPNVNLRAQDAVKNASIDWLMRKRPTCVSPAAVLGANQSYWVAATGSGRM